MLMVTTAEEKRHAFDLAVNAASARERVQGGARPEDDLGQQS